MPAARDPDRIGEQQQRFAQEEFRSCVRALLMTPLMSPADEDFVAVRRQAEPLRTALDHYRDMQIRLGQAAHEVRLALPELRRQCKREDEARDDLRQREEAFGSARIDAASILA